MIAGLEQITSGEVSVGGRVVNDLEPADRDIAMVFQNYALYPSARGRDRGRPGHGRRVTVGLRPEDITIAPADGTFVLTVDIAEHLGTDTIVHGHLNGAVRDAVTMRCDSDCELSAGSKTGISIPACGLHLFDRETGRRLEWHGSAGEG